MHQWTLEGEDRTCEWNVTDPREAHGSACRSAKNARMRKMQECEKCENAKNVRCAEMRNLRDMQVRK
jgi:hypothetical protein